MASMRIREDADHVNTSICPGISTMNNFFLVVVYLSFCSILDTMIYGCAKYKLSAVNIAPLGPSLYYFITSL